MAYSNTSTPALPIADVRSTKWHDIPSSSPSLLVHTSSDPSSALTPSSSCDPSSTSTLATLQSIRMRTQLRQPKPRKVPKPPPRVTESDKLMLAEEIYIGPVKRKGRPAKGSGVTAENEIDAGTSVIAPCSSSLDPSDDLILMDEPEAEEASITSASKRTTNQVGRPSETSDPMKCKAKTVKRRSRT